MYEEYNDYELLSLIAEENEDAGKILYDKYKNLVIQKAKKYQKTIKNKGIDYTDLIQEGMIGLSEAIRDFTEQKDVKFFTFASICIERQISTAILKATRKKHSVLNNSLSLDYENDNEKTMLDFISSTDTEPSSYLETKENNEQLIDKVRKELTDMETRVFDLKIDNYDTNEIALLLDKSYKSIDSTIYRIRLKTNKILESER